MNHSERMMLSLDMICEIGDEYYDLASFASPEAVVTTVRKDVISIAKIEHNLTVITFYDLLDHGQATLYFESKEDAKSFNRSVYKRLKKNLVVIT